MRFSPDDLTARMDEVEEVAFQAALADFEQAGTRGGGYVPRYIQDLKDDRINMEVAMGAIRHYALIDTNTRIPDGLLEVGNIDNLRALRPYLSVARQVATPMAVAYFRVLKTYLDRQRSGEPELDDLSDEIALRAGLLMRQVEGLVEDWNALPRERWDVDGHERVVQYLVDWDIVKRETELYNLFPDSRWNHYVGEARDPEADHIYPFEPTHTPYSGLRPHDLLLFLNDRLPVQIQVGESFRPSRPVDAVIHPDGRVDLGDPRTVAGE